MNMKTLAATGLCVVASAAWANPVQVNSPGAAQVYGDGSAASAATARSAATAGATAGAIANPTITASPTATAIGGAATGGTATINITRGGGGGHGNGASRGAGAGTPSAAGTPLNAGAGTGAGGGTGDSAGSGRGTTLSAPPGFGLPAFGGGQCATVGFGIAVSPSGGGAFGPAWESTNCRNYYIAVTLIQAGRVDQGMQLLSMITPEAKQVMASSPAPTATTPVVDEHAIDLCTARPGWSAAELAARYPECKR